MPPSAAAAYETLRDDILNGRARPEGLAALRFHGLAQGLAILLKAPTGAPSTACTPLCPTAGTHRDFVRLLANLVLHTHSEVTHVC